MEEDHEGGPDGHPCGEAAEFLHRAGVVSLVDHADQEEQGAGREAVVEHVEDRALEAGVIERCQAEDAEAQVGDGGVRDELLDVALHPADEAGVDDADDRDDGDGRGVLGDGQGREAEGEAVDAIGAEFEQPAGEDDGTGGGRLGVRQRQPGVQREERDLTANPA
jgi:hypothetical protein